MSRLRREAGSGSPVSGSLVSESPVSESPVSEEQDDRMTPLIGPISLGDFAHPWFFLFLLVVAGLVGLYVVVQVARQQRILRFANMDGGRAAPKRPSRWRHVPAILPGVAGAADRRDGRPAE